MTFLKLNSRGLAFASLAALLWGFVPVYIGAVGAVDPIELVVHRALWSAVILLFMLICLPRLTGGLKAARAALDLLPDSPAATRALAHALMFKGDTDAARAIYDPLMANEEGRAAVLSDFAALAFLGRQATLMDELRDIAAE